MSIRRLTFATMFSLLSMFTLGLVWAGVAGAYAALEGPPVYSTAPGLPDGRVYEEVSPADKDGNEAGASSLLFEGQPPGARRYALASAEGDSILFEGTGPMGEEVSSASILWFVSTRSSSGWHTRSLTPRPQQSQDQVGVLEGDPEYIDMSADFSHAIVKAGPYTLAPLPDESCYGEMYLTGSDPFVPGLWLARPETTSPLGLCEAGSEEGGVPVGGTPDFSTVYFADPETLLPEDAPRVPHANLRSGGGDVEAWGLYEDDEGALHEAGVLPDGSLDAFGAVPAASEHSLTVTGNQVSKDGSRLFFVSPDPVSCEQNGGENDCAVDPPELYVREDGKRTLLVSKDTLSPAVGGLPASAPDGVLRTPQDFQESEYYAKKFDGSYVFASPDGSQAFFQSEDQLTATAPEGPPVNTGAKIYDFDTNTGALTYLPNVVGNVVGTSKDGSSMVFVRPASGSSPAELDLWTAGPGGGSVIPITVLPGGGKVEPVGVSNDGSVVVFTATGVPGFNDVGTNQIFRYDVQANTLGCVSCSPAGVVPSNASMSMLRETQARLEYSAKSPTEDDRGMSENGDRVFFQTQAPLVPQDSNTNAEVPGENHKGSEREGMDVYEWENGVVYLISTGNSPRNSYYLDSSENGNDVFFATTSELVPGDTDGGYSVYDARVPRPGDNPPPAAVPCTGSVCQGPPKVQAPLGAPASATFTGLGNTPTEQILPAAAKAKPKAKILKCKKGFVKKKDRCVKAKTKKSSASVKGGK